MDKFLGLVLFVCGLILLPVGIGIPMVIQGCRVMAKSPEGSKTPENA
jgi:hypothetical protein